MSHLSQKQLDHFKEMLEERKQSIEAELGSIAKKDPNLAGDWDSTYPIFDEGFKLEDASDEVEEYINRLPVEQALELRLQAIDAALTRIKKDTYGQCNNCKKDISVKRLEAMPETQLCLDCPANRRARA